MSIPAVLYDHVPVDDSNFYGNIEKGKGRSVFFVSPIVHRASAPKGDDSDGDNGVGSSKQFEQPRFVDNEKGNYEIKDGGNTNGKGNLKHVHGIEDVENDEICDHPMETIIEDIGSDYVHIPPIPPPTMSNYNNNKVLPGSSYSMMSVMCKKIRSRGCDLLSVTVRSSKSNCYWIREFWMSNTTVAKCWSGCASGSRALMKPLQLYARDFISPSIHSSYDWVSETVIDSSGNRLVLPGPCVSLDSNDLQSPIIDGDSKHCDNHSAGMLIVPAGTDATGLNSGIDPLKRIPITSSLLSSLWASNTFMVSAHDLLAVKEDRNAQRRDRERNSPSYLHNVVEGTEEEEIEHIRCYNRDDFSRIDRPTLSVATTQHVVLQMARALWKLTRWKTNSWYCTGQTYIQCSIKKAGHQFIHSPKFLFQYCKLQKTRRKLSLVVSPQYNFGSSEDHACSNAQNESQASEQAIICSTMLTTSPQKLPHESFYDRTSMSEDDDWTFVIEMTTQIPMHQNSESQYMSTKLSNFTET